MEKILIVDDDEDLLLVLKHALKGQGYAVTTLPDPSRLHSVIDRLGPDIIILDINMGQWDGRKICESLKANPAYGQIPVVLYSGLSADKESIARSKADLFLQKPLSTSYFLKKLGELTTSSVVKLRF